MATQTADTNFFETWQLLQEFNDNGKPFQMAMGIAQCPNGDFVVADPVDIRVGLFTSDGVFKMNLNSCNNDNGKLFKPSDVAVTSDGSIVVVDKSPNVKIFNADSGLFTFSFKTTGRTGIGTCDSHVCPAAVRVHHTAAGRVEYIYVLDILRRILTCHEKDGKCVKTIPTGGAPNYFSVVDPARFIVSDYTNHRFRVIDASGEDVLVIDTPVGELGRQVNAVGTCVDDTNGEILAALGRRQGHCVIHRYSGETGTFAGCAATNLTNPFNIIITMDGKLAVADKRTVKIFERK